MALARAPWRRLRAAADELTDDAPDEALHELRIKAKRARYAAEAVAPVAGRGAKRFAAELTHLQDVLGEHQDAIVAQSWLREQLPNLAGDPRAAFVAGLLAAAEADAADAARRRWPAVWQAARRRRLRRWMQASR